MRGGKAFTTRETPMKAVVRVGVSYLTLNGAAVV
jgi:hypothetical protein